MSIRHGLLALLAERRMYGNQLRAEFEARTGGAWALNVGQVYTTLDRLVRDGFVAAAGADDDGRDLYELTDPGRRLLAGWWSSPVTRESRPRDELTIKLALAVTAPGVDVRAVVQTQRSDTMRSLQEYTRLKNTRADGAHASDLSDTAWLLVLESMIFQAEAEMRWLDHCEKSLVTRAERNAAARAAASPEATASPAAAQPPEAADETVKRGRR